MNLKIEPEVENDYESLWKWPAINSYQLIKKKKPSIDFVQVLLQLLFLFLKKNSVLNHGYTISPSTTFQARCIQLAMEIS